MVVYTKCYYKKSQDSYSGNISEKNVVPPWCSSGKVYERRKPRKVIPAHNIKSFYTARDNIWEYLNEDKVGNIGTDEAKNKTLTNKKIKSAVKRSKSRTILLLLFLLIIGIMSQYFKPNEIFDEVYLIIKNLPATRFICYLGMDSTPVNEECCHSMKHLALALKRAEQALRALRHRKTTLSSRNIHTGFVQEETEAGHVECTLAMAGKNTTEWGGNIALWGILPIWRSAPPPDTVLKRQIPIPSDCWPFRGSYGEIIIKMPKSMPINKLSVEHIRPDTALSAPKYFMVFGILGDGTWMKAAYGIYEYNKPAKQYFNLNNRNVPFQQIVFRVLSNQGNMKYTCIYRIRLYASSYKLSANKPV